MTPNEFEAFKQLPEWIREIGLVNVTFLNKPRFENAFLTTENLEALALSRLTVMDCIDFDPIPTLDKFSGVINKLGESWGFKFEDNEFVIFVKGRKVIADLKDILVTDTISGTNLTISTGSDTMQVINTLERTPYYDSRIANAKDRLEKLKKEKIKIEAMASSMPYMNAYVIVGEFDIEHHMDNLEVIVLKDKRKKLLFTINSEEDYNNMIKFLLNNHIYGVIHYEER